jgi:transcriptional regulator GlxA family with amidase domain
LRRREKPIAPRDVKRAIDYMQGHLDVPIRLADVVQASGVPGRTLFKHFNDCRGLSPMRYLRNARLDHIREMLVRAQPEESVTEIAMQWGFTHMGRFSIEYRRRFGESPSETLSRAACSLSYSPNSPSISFSDFRAAWWKTRRSG